MSKLQKFSRLGPPVGGRSAAAASADGFRLDQKLSRGRSSRRAHVERRACVKYGKDECVVWEARKQSESFLSLSLLFSLSPLPLPLSLPHTNTHSLDHPLIHSLSFDLALAHSLLRALPLALSLARTPARSRVRIAYVRVACMRAYVRAYGMWLRAC
eukprot:2179382-Pleurochrysis_carterae.AAC.1